MSDKDDSREAAEREAEERDDAGDAEDGGDSEDSENESSDEEAPPPSRRASSPRSERSERSKSSRAASRRAPASNASQRTVIVGVIALAAGIAAGWFGHVAQAKAKTRGETVASPATGACGSWQQKICSSSGAQSAACEQAKGATDLLTASACEVALEAMPATLAKVKADRAPCDKLVKKLCEDLPPGSETCNMIKEQTPKFPKQRCDEMNQNYEQVVMEVKALDQRSQMMRGHGPGDGHGHAPPGSGMPADPHGH